MRAAVFEQLQQPLVVRTLPDPVPKAGEVIIRVHRCGICGSDLHLTEEAIFGIPSGSVLGHEYAGEVVACGNEVTGLKIGDPVAVMPTRGCGRCASCLSGEPAWCARFVLDGGGYAELSRATPPQCIPLPRTVSLEDGALVEPIAVALRGVNLAGLRAGTSVLVIGAGPIGLAVAFWARRLGAGRIAVTAASTRRAELAHRLGADAFIAPDEDLAAGAARVLGGAPEVVFECVGKPGLIQRSIELVRPRGLVVVLGLCTLPDTISPFLAVSKEARIQPSAFYGVREFEIAIDTLAAGHVEPRAMITDRVPLNDMVPAFEALKHRTTQCKVLVDCR
ncbi:MAG: alcohol dehydrogenase catalytic domain-containing protein [Gammaproteobacteria bacterium]|nr:alcohol dehydrogenase catalytic domain-containing protein [Gammaproteobacteria bacterium]